MKKKLLSLLTVTLSLTLSAQTGASQADLKKVKDKAEEAYNYADKAKQTENFSEAKSYIQTVLLASKEAKNSIINIENLLIEQEKQISNSTNKELIENIKDQREEIVLAKEEANIAHDFAEKANQAKDLETLHNCAIKILKAQRKIIRQIEATRHYSSLINDTKIN